MQRGLLEAGCTVVLNARNAQALERTRHELAEQTGGTAYAMPFITSPDAVTAGVERVEVQAGPLDILVNNAGLQRRAPLLEFSDADWHALVATNMTSAFLVGRQVARRMAARGAGKIVNVCSLQRLRPVLRPAAGGGCRI